MYDAKTLGAKGDFDGVNESSATDNTPILNNILSTYRGNKIYIPKGNYLISSDLIIFSNTTLILHPQAELHLKSGVGVNASQGYLYASPHLIKNDLRSGTQNIKIIGGIWNGNGKNQAHDSTRGIYMENVTGLEIGNLLMRSINGWGGSHYACNDFQFHDIKFDQLEGDDASYDGNSYGKGANGDGITGNSSNGIIENISGYTNDDMIDLQAGIPWLVGKGYNLNISNVVIKNIRPTKKNNSYTWRAFALYCGDGYTMENVTVSDVEGTTDNGFKITHITGTTRNGTFKKISLSNIKTQVANKVYWQPYAVGELSNTTITDLTIDGISAYQTADLLQAIPMITVVNAKILTFNLSNAIYVCEDPTSNKALVYDTGEIDNINFNNITYINNTVSTKLLIYAKNYTGSNNADTTVRASNIYTTPLNLVDINIARWAGNLRVKSIDGIVDVTTINIPQIFDVVNDKNNGLSMYDGKVFVPLLSRNNITNFITSTTYTVNSRADWLLLSANNNNYSITLGANCQVSGYKFKMNIPANATVTLYDAAGSKMFSETTFNNGIFEFLYAAPNWCMYKLSSAPLSLFSVS